VSLSGRLGILVFALWSEKLIRGNAALETFKPSSFLNLGEVVPI
jgi:hypothetical protein